MFRSSSFIGAPRASGSRAAAHRAVRRVVIDGLRHQSSIENVRQHIAARDDVDLIPIVGLDQRLEFVAAAQIGNDLFLPLL